MKVCIYSCNFQPYIIYKVKNIYNDATKRSISTLKSKLLQPALTSHFEVTIPSGNVPDSIKIGKEEQEDLNLFCTETLPGSSVNVFEVNMILWCDGKFATEKCMMEH